MHLRRTSAYSWLAVCRRTSESPCVSPVQIQPVKASDVERSPLLTCQCVCSLRSRQTQSRLPLVHPRQPPLPQRRSPMAKASKHRRSPPLRLPRRSLHRSPQQLREPQSQLARPRPGSHSDAAARVAPHPKLQRALRRLSQQRQRPHRQHQPQLQLPRPPLRFRPLQQQLLSLPPASRSDAQRAPRNPRQRQRR